MSDEFDSFLSKYGGQTPAPVTQGPPAVGGSGDEFDSFLKKYSQPASPKADLPGVGTVPEPSPQPAAPAPPRPSMDLPGVLPKPMPASPVQPEAAQSGPPPAFPPAYGGTPAAPAEPSQLAIGAKEAMADHVARWSSLIDPTSFMSGQGIDPNAPGVRESMGNVPETREERLKVAKEAMTQGVFPEGAPAPPTGVTQGVLRGIGAAPVALTELAMLAPVAGALAPEAAIAKTAATFALQGLTGEKPLSGAVHGAALGAILGLNHQIAGKIAQPVLQWLTKIGGGMAIGGGATALEGGGPQEIAKDAIIFGLFELMGMPRGKAAEGKPGEMKIDWDWMEKNKVPKETIEALKNQTVDSPEFVKAVDDTSRSILGQTSETAQPASLKDKARAFYDGPQAKIIEASEGKNDAVQKLSEELGGEDRAGRFYDLYKTGDLDTIAKEFPDQTPWATEQQKRAATGPGPEPEAVPQPMGPQGSTPVTEAPPTEKPPAAAPPGTEGGSAAISTTPAEESPKKRGALVAPKPSLADTNNPMGTGVETGRVEEAAIPDVAKSATTEPPTPEAPSGEAKPEPKLSLQEGGGGEEIAKGHVEKAFPGGKVSQSELFHDVYQVDLPDGQRIMVHKNGTIEVNPAALEAGYGQKSLGPGESIAGEYRRGIFDQRGIITLAKGEGMGTLNHESFHSAMDLALTPREKAAVLKTHGDEEAAARAYETWDPKAEPNTVFGKIMDFFRGLYRNLFPNAETVFGKVKTGEAWDRGNKAGLPGEIGPKRYKVATADERELDRYGDFRSWAFKPVTHAADLLRGVQRILLPGAVSKEHRAAAEVMGAGIGTRQREAKVVGTKFAPDRRMFDKLGVHDKRLADDQNPGLDFSFRADEGQPQQGKTPEQTKELQRIADGMAERNAENVRRLEAVDAPLRSTVESYFGRAYTPESVRAFRQSIREAIDAGRGMEAIEGNVGGQVMDLNSWHPDDRAWVKNRVQELKQAGEGSDDQISFLFPSKRPLGGRESFREGRTFDFMRTAMDFGLEPTSRNPVDLFLAKDHEVNESVAVHGALQEWKAKGQAKFVPANYSPARGFKKWDGKYGTVYGDFDPVTRTLPIKGYWAVTEPVYDILKNYTSRSLYADPNLGKFYRGYMAVGNLLNQFQLTSFFHAGFTTAETQIRSAAEILKDIWGVFGAKNRTLEDLGHSVKRYPLAFTRFATEGTALLKEHANPSVIIPTDVPVSQLTDTPTGRVAIIAKAVELAGGHFGMDERFKTHQSDKAIRDWYSGHKLRAIMRTPVVMTEMLMKPIMNGMVPRQKAAVFAELAGRVLEMNPDKTMGELRGQFRDAWSAVDATLGQVGYERLFMNNATKTLLQAGMRAPGWTGGTIAWVGGAPVDFAKFVTEWYKTGKPPAQLPDRVAYTLSLLGTVAVANGLMTLLFTGQQPKGMDFWAFRNGEKDSKGRDVRYLFPTYAKDLFAWYENPGHTATSKVHPLLSLLDQLRQNKDYYGNQVYDPLGPQSQQAVDLGKFVVKQYIPFGIRGTQQLLAGEQGKSVSAGQVIAPQFGIMPAPRAYTNTKLDDVVDEYNRLNRASVTTKETSALKSLKSDLMKLARDGDQEGFREKAQAAIQSGQLTRQQAKQIAGDSQVPPGMRRFYQMPIEWMTRAMEAGSDYEKEKFLPYVLKKITGAKPELLIRSRDSLVPMLQELGLDDVAQAVQNLSINEADMPMDLANLGVLKPQPQLGNMAEVDRTIADYLANLGEGKKKGLGLGLHLPSMGLNRQGSEKKKVNQFLGV